jgi:hypothetical protein
MTQQIHFIAFQFLLLFTIICYLQFSEWAQKLRCSKEYGWCEEGNGTNWGGKVYSGLVLRGSRLQQRQNLPEELPVNALLC